MDKKILIRQLEARIEYENEHEHDVPSEFSNSEAERKAWKDGYVTALMTILFNISTH